MRGKIVKNLLLKTKRHKEIYLIIFPAERGALNLKALGKSLSVGSGLRGAQPDMVFEMEAGTVTPLATIFDKSKVVHTLLDSTLEKAHSINVHPGTNQATVGIAPKDLVAYLDKYSNGAKYVDLMKFDKR